MSERPTDTNNVNYRYFVDMITSLPNASQLKVLDYGCGMGMMVQMLRDAGIDCYGVEVCYPGANYDELRARDLYKQGILCEISDDGKVPFEDGFFDVIISNQVFEHVVDKPTVLANLKRALNDDGFMHHHFPSKEVMREGHTGIPFSHWFPKGRLRYIYAYTLRRIGFGYHKDKNQSTAEWTEYYMDWIDKYCTYERYRPMRSMLEKSFVVSHVEIDYCRFRAKGRPALLFLLGIKPAKPLFEHMFRSLAFMAMRLNKRTEELQRSKSAA